MATLLESVLAEEHARFGDRRSGLLAVDFGSIDGEYETLRKGCGLIDPAFRAFTRVVGEDRRTFLQGMLSNDVAALQPGAGIRAAILTVQARVVSDLRVFVLDDEIWLDCPAQRRALVVETLNKYIVADDVELQEPTMVPLVLLEGPTSASVLRDAFGADVASLPRWSHLPVDFEGVTVRCIAVTHSGESGVLLVGPAQSAVPAWRAARAAGASPVGFDTLDVARIEAGIAEMDADMDESYLAPEVGLADAVSTRKGCYIGQEVVERVSSRGNVQRKLIGLELEATTPVAAGTALLEDGREVGVITSCTFSPSRNRVIALAYARRTVWAPGTRVAVATSAPDDAMQNSVAVVAELPFIPAGASL